MDNNTGEEFQICSF